MKSFSKYISLLLLLGILFGQDGSPISGKVIDAKSNEFLYGVNILVKNTYIGTSTDKSGEFIIEGLADRPYELIISMIGYKKRILMSIVPSIDQFLTIELEQDVLASPSVIVTAARKEQDIMDSPLSVSVVGQRQITEKSSVSLAEALVYLPGVNTVYDQLNIRGASGYTLGAGSRSLLLIDGIPLLGSAAGNITWSIVPTSEIERVEIVKSGGSALYGSSAMGGVLNVITRNVRLEPETRIRLKAGIFSSPKYEQWKWKDDISQFNVLEITHSRPIGKHGFWVRLQRENTDGYTELGWEESYNITSKLKLNFSPQLNGSLYGNYYQSKNGLTSQWKSAADPFEAPTGDENDSAEGYKLNMNGFLNYILSKKTAMKLKLGLYDIEWQNDGRTNQDYSHETKGFGEYQITKNWNDNFNTIIGYSSQYAKIDAKIFGDHHSNSQAVYLLTQLKLLELVNLSLGGRYEGYWVDNELLDDTFAPQIALNWNNGILALRTSYGKGFRVPTVAEMFTRSQLNVFQVEPNPNLIAETSDAIEAGSSLLIADVGPLSLLKIDAAIFHNRFKNLIEPLPDQNGIIHFENITDAIINGAEIGLNVGILNNKIIAASSYTYLNPVEINDDGEVTDTLSYRFRHNLVNSITGYWKKFNANVEYRFASRIESVELFEENAITDSDKRVPIHLWNISTGYRNNDWEVLFRIENVFQYYYTELERNMGKERNISVNISKIF